MIFKVLQKVFKKKLYIFIAFTTAILVFLFAVWFPNFTLILKIMNHQGISFLEKISIPISLLGSIGTNFTLFTAISTIIIAILFGINISMIIYFVRMKITQIKQSGIFTGFFGIISGVLGMGCAACGSLLLTAILSLFGVTWIISYLPLGGGEFSILAIILLIISINKISKRISNPLICKIK